MDTSEQYVKMCWEAVEIQNLYDSEKADPLLNDVLISYKDNMGKLPDINEDDLIWLPRQDQLQYIHGNKYLHLDGIEHPYNFIHWLHQGYKNKKKFDYIPYASIESIVDTWEKFWLVFVMYECYGKIWQLESNSWKNIRLIFNDWSNKT